MALAASIGLPPPTPTRPSQPRVAITIQAGQDIGLGRVGLDVAEDDRLLSQRAGDQGGQTRMADQPGIGHDQRARDPQPGQLAGQESAAAGAEEDAVRKGEHRDGADAVASRRQKPGSAGRAGADRSLQVSEPPTVIEERRCRPRLLPVWTEPITQVDRRSQRESTEHRSSACSISAAACQSPAARALAMPARKIATAASISPVSA